MYHVSIWVPTKGWVKIRSFRERLDAILFAEALDPLETMVSHKGRHLSYGGRLHITSYDTPPARGHRY